jgi:hypothetical protein
MAILDQTAPVGDAVVGSNIESGQVLRSLSQGIRRNAARLGFLATVFVLYIGWMGRFERNITAENGLGYALGIIGGSMMAALLLYPLRKRYRVLHFLGATRYWFRTHMVLGVIGPVLILYHCNFSVSSLNSRVALFCTLLVAVSGIIGRYLYAQIHQGLYGEKLNLRSLVGEMQQSLEQITVFGTVTEKFLRRLNAISSAVLEPPQSVFRSALRPLYFAVTTRWAYMQMSMDLRRAPEAQAEVCDVFTHQEQKMASAIRHQVWQHLRQVRRVAHLSFFERLFSLWHILHLPFFLMLLISAIVHIVAVHLY